MARPNFITPLTNLILLKPAELWPPYGLHHTPGVVHAVGLVRRSKQVADVPAAQCGATNWKQPTPLFLIQAILQVYIEPSRSMYTILAHIEVVQGVNVGIIFHTGCLGIVNVHAMCVFVLADGIQCPCCACCAGIDQQSTGYQCRRRSTTTHRSCRLRPFDSTCHVENRARLLWSKGGAQL